MTYCIGLKLNRGLVMMSDTRTNAGVDNISMYKKMFTWEIKGERVISIMTAGNLATTQAVVGMLEERMKIADERTPSILKAKTMFQVAQLVGQTLKEVITNATNGQEGSTGTFGASIIVAGQIEGGNPCIFMIYPEGNFIEASDDTPFLQIGETKYGRPILVRAYDPEMSFEDAVKLLMVSFDSTIKANLSVGLPLDMLIYKTDALEIERAARIGADDPQYRVISSGWGDALRSAFSSLPDVDLSKI